MRDNPTGGFVPPKNTVEGAAWHDARKRPPSPAPSAPLPPSSYSPPRPRPQPGGASKRSDGDGGFVGGIIGLFVLLALLSTCAG